MLSRVANSLYWMSRYLERADNIARFIDVNTRLILDMGSDHSVAQWDPLVRASGDEQDFNQRYDESSETNVIRFLTFDPKNTNSILSCVQSARENARSVREIISSEMWETINTLYHLLSAHSRKRTLQDLHAVFEAIHHACHRFTGLTENIMSHGEGWHFTRMGCLLERADKTARILDVKYFLLLPSTDYFDSPYDSVEWGAVLKSVSGFEMYRKQFHRANYRNVTQFLILDKYFPRAIRYCINTAASSLSHITDLLQVAVPASQEIAKIQATLDTTDLDCMLNQGVHEFIDAFQYNLNMVDEQLYRSFFELSENSKLPSPMAMPLSMDPPLSERRLLQ